ncbi:unnamed protein product [Closterium sp. NIES-64]|nr:unnamed protein product [Closterium sp. NIES-64]
MAISSGSISESAFRGVTASRSIRSLSEFAGRPVATNAILTGACKHRASSPRPITFSLQSHIIASTSASAASSAAMGSATVPASGGGEGGEAAPFRQMTPEEHWWWGTPEFMMGNWHGQWRSWKPLESTDENRSMKSVRKLWATSPDRSSFAHVNDWYDFQGEAPAYMPKVGVQWDMSLAQHSLPDGFCHVVASKSRRYAVSRQADAIWGPIEVADGAGGIMLPFFIEFFFAHKEWNPNGTTAAADTAAAAAAGFMGRVPQGDEERYAVVSLPQQVVDVRPSLATAGGSKAIRALCVMGGGRWTGGRGRGDRREGDGLVKPPIHQQQLVAGRPFVLSVSWVVGGGLVGEGEVKRITAYWGADGGFEKVEGEWYRREA